MIFVAEEMRFCDFSNFPAIRKNVMITTEQECHVSISAMN